MDGLSHIPDAVNSMHVPCYIFDNGNCKFSTRLKNRSFESSQSFENETDVRSVIIRDCKMTLQLGDMLATRMCCHISIVDMLQDIKPIREPALDLCRMSTR